MILVVKPCLSYLTPVAREADGTVLYECRGRAAGTALWLQTCEGLDAATGLPDVLLATEQVLVDARGRVWLA